MCKKQQNRKKHSPNVDVHPLCLLITLTRNGEINRSCELQAQTTLINFTVTKMGLEDQLLAEVVKADRPDLEEQKAELTRQQNEYKILLKVTISKNSKIVVLGHTRSYFFPCFFHSHKF